MWYLVKTNKRSFCIMSSAYADSKNYGIIKGEKFLSLTIIS
jgi:hypothetical protein